MYIHNVAVSNSTAGMLDVNIAETGTVVVNTSTGIIPTSTIITGPLDSNGNLKIDIEDVSGAPQSAVNQLNVTGGSGGPATNVNISNIGGVPLAT